MAAKLVEQQMGESLRVPDRWVVDMSLKREILAKLIKTPITERQKRISRGLKAAWARKKAANVPWRKK